MNYSLASAIILSLMCGTITIAAAQTAPGAPVKIAGSGSAATLTDAKGMTLYVYDKDAAGKSACTGPCAANWPPLTATAADKPSGKYTIVKRDDGSLMWAYDGKPLYTWKNDKAPGDTTGDGIAGTWHVAHPQTAPAERPQAVPPPPGGGSAY